MSRSSFKGPESVMSQLLSEIISLNNPNGLQGTSLKELFLQLLSLNPFAKNHLNQRNGHAILLSVHWLIHFLRSKQYLTNSMIKRYFSLSQRNTSEKRLITYVTHAFSHNSLSHLILNSLLFFTAGRVISEHLSAKQMLVIYLIGSIVSGVILQVLKGKKNDFSYFQGSNGGYAALAGYFSLAFPKAEFEVFGKSIPPWLMSLISLLLCISQKNNDTKRNGLVEFAGFFTGILIELLAPQFNSNQAKSSTTNKTSYEHTTILQLS